MVKPPAGGIGVVVGTGDTEGVVVVVATTVADDDPELGAVVSGMAAFVVVGWLIETPMAIGSGFVEVQDFRREV